MTRSTARDDLVPNVFPVGMQNSELVLRDEEGDSVVTELDELSSASEQNICPAAINIENSKDVIVGPVTQFHGPVTIYQNTNGTSPTENSKKNHNGKLVKSESTSSEASHGVDKPNKTFLYSSHLKFIGIPLLLIILISIITCVVILSQKSKDSMENSEEGNERTDFSEDDDSLKPIGPGSLITRAKWGGHPALNSTRPLKHPTPLIIISHTATPVCETVSKCSQRVLSIQDHHIGTVGLPDIGYNFLIGGDANVYVGRGWDVKNMHSDNSIGITFIGNYLYNYLSANMIQTAKSLIEEGVRKKKLSEDYKVICHNQTYATLSPGPHVYQVVKTWSHFDPSSYTT